MPTLKHATGLTLKKKKRLQLVQVKAHMRGRYELAEPQLYIRESYANTLHTKLLCNAVAMNELIHAFDEELLKKIKGSIRKVVVSKIAAKRLLSKILQVRKQYAGSLLHTIRSINNLEIKQNGDFGEGSIMMLLTSSRMHPLTWLLCRHDRKVCLL